MSDLAISIKKRGTLKSKLTHFSKVLSTILNGETITEVEVMQIIERVEALKEVKFEFEDIQGAIENLVDDSDLDNQLESRHKFEDEYFKQIALAKRFLRTNEDKLNPSNSIANSVVNRENSINEINQHSDSLNHVRLPTINLPKYSGVYQNWLEFRDTFHSLIHENNTVSKIQKFHYLRASLEGDAALVIKSLEISAANYEVAWSALLERYDNNKLLIYNHVKSLFNGEPVVRESASGLRKLIDDFSKNLRALGQLNQPVTEWDTLLVYLISTKLDHITLREWEQVKAELENPNFKDIKDFLKSRADMLEMIAQNQTDKRKNSNSNTRTFLVTDSQPRTPLCVVCEGNHYIHNCQQFIKLSVNERESKAKALKLCTNCLKKGHYSKVCRRGTCIKCHGKHNTLLHRERNAFVGPEQRNEVNANAQNPSTNNNQQENSVVLSACGSVDHVFLSTAYVQVLNNDGNFYTARALLDSGAQSSFMTKDLCQRLKLKTYETNITVKSLNNISSNIKFKCEMALKSLYNDYSCTKWFFVIDKISENLPAVNIDVSKLNMPPHISLADPTYFKPSKIEILIGSDIFWEVISTGQVSLGPNNPILQKTQFGWIVSGPIKLITNSVSCNFIQNTDTDIEIQKCLTKFWEVEETPLKPPRSNEENACEQHFTRYTKRDKDGRFVVTLPFKDTPEKLGSSRETAVKRFMSLERKLEGDTQLKNLYSDFIREYEALGHMSRVQDTEPDKLCYYMPHHGVIKNDSITTKLRVVFDASSPTSSRLSLNNLQYVGPTLQQTLFSILLRFRQHKFVISADITKMYRQILIEPEQYRFQRILWRQKPGDPLATYELKTVTYGTTAASFLAIRCLFQLAKENESKHPKMSEIIKTDFYVDDLLSGADDLEEAARMCSDISDILKQGGFELRKFYSNKPDVLKYVDNTTEDHHTINFGEYENAKTLGIMWQPSSDKLVYKISDINETRISKRSILSNVSQVWDPLGLLAPCIIQIKILLQKLWLEKVSWDEAVPEKIDSFWREFRADLPILNSLNVARRAICDGAVGIEMHGFSDASEDAYGACIYLRSMDASGVVVTKLLCAKSKVAPLKTVTMPRLELMAAVTLARLASEVKRSLRIKIDQCVYWSDSTVVLGWLKHSPNQLKSFVGNRVAEIQEVTATDTWRHVSSKNNPADLVSRGVKPRVLLNNSMWWDGPPYLRQEEASWPEYHNKNENLPDIRKKKVHLFISCSENDFIKNFSDINKLKRITAYMRRFYLNCSKKLNGEIIKTGPLEALEIDRALICLIKLSQLDFFQRDINKLKNDKQIIDGKILNLNPFLDHDSVLRVGGRLTNAKFAFEKKHPAILSSKSHLTELLVRNTHLRLLHAGPQHTLVTLRERFWIVGGRILVKKLVRKCIPCFKYKPTQIQPIMASLPEMRLKSKHPFEFVGVDYAGPMSVKSKSGRGYKTSKSYICLFICFVTKAMHTELVSDLSTDAFLLALKRFVSRRGKPVCIYSDNGTNFVGANNALKELGKFISKNETNLTNSFQAIDITWKFIPPRSPHFGGLWESGIKSIKHHLRRVTRDLLFTFEQLYTILAEVEAILNSRPLSPLSDSPHDLCPLTPSHFLIGRSSNTVPEPDLSHLPRNRLSLYQHLTQVKQHLWKRWNKEYVSELQKRTKWKFNFDTLKPDTLVLLKEDNQPPMKWKLGRVETVHPGADGVARVATIRTTDGHVKRSFAKICPLPLDDKEEYKD